MQSFDSLSLLYFYSENKDFINGAIVQKIQLPSRYEIILNLRNLNLDKQENKKLYININPKYPHICFIDELSSKKRNIQIPKSPPMFCMQLRKYLSGSKIKDFRVVKYERIIELYFDYFDEIGSLTRLCLALEFMGKHSNIILYNANTKIILGSIHNISSDKSSIREVYGGISYIYPPIKQKLDILNTSYSTFFEFAKNKDIKAVSNNFYYFSQDLLKKVFSKFDSIEDIFNFMQEFQNLEHPEFIKSFWHGSVDCYFSNIMFDEILKNQKAKLKKYLSSDIKKLSKTLENRVDDKKALDYKQKADLIMTNLYSIENTAEPLKEAQKYYSMYKKALETIKHAKKREQEAQDKLSYFETIVFNIEQALDFKELEEIKEELIDLGYITNEKKEKNKINIEKQEFRGYEIYIGKNNKQNDYLISKIASNEDLWFHGLNYPSAHIILKVPNNKKEPSKEVLEYCAKLTKDRSKAKDSTKASIIFTKRKNLKKPPNTYLGYVTYKNEVEVVI